MGRAQDRSGRISGCLHVRRVLGLASDAEVPTVLGGIAFAIVAPPTPVVRGPPDGSLNGIWPFEPRTGRRWVRLGSSIDPAAAAGARLRSTSERLNSRRSSDSTAPHRTRATRHADPINICKVFYSVPQANQIQKWIKIEQPACSRSSKAAILVIASQ